MILVVIHYALAVYLAGVIFFAGWMIGLRVEMEEMLTDWSLVVTILWPLTFPWAIIRRLRKS